MGVLIRTALPTVNIIELELAQRREELVWLLRFVRSSANKLRFGNVARRTAGGLVRTTIRFGGFGGLWGRKASITENHKSLKNVTVSLCSFWLTMERAEWIWQLQFIKLHASQSVNLNATYFVIINSFWNLSNTPSCLSVRNNNKILKNSNPNQLCYQKLQWYCQHLSQSEFVLFFVTFENFRKFTEDIDLIIRVYKTDQPKLKGNQGQCGNSERGGGSMPATWRAADSYRAVFKIRVMRLKNGQNFNWEGRGRPWLNLICH